MTWECPLCSHFASFTFKKLLRHLSSVHSYDARFNLTCGIEGCPRIYTNFHSYKSHVYRKHREVVDLPEPSMDNSVNGPATPEVPTDLVYDERDVEPQTVSERAEAQKKAEARFLLKAKHLYKISQSSLESMIGDIGEMMEFQMTSVQRDVASILTSRGVTLDNDLRDALSLKPGQPFSGLRSQYQQQQYFREKLHLLVRKFL